MSRETAIQLFEERKGRSAWDAEAEKWYISIPSPAAASKPNPTYRPLPRLNAKSVGAIEEEEK